MEDCVLQRRLQDSHPALHPVLLSSMTRLRSTPFSPSNFHIAPRVCVSSQVQCGEANSSDTPLSSSASAVYYEIGWCLASSLDNSVLKRSCVLSMEAPLQEGQYDCTRLALRCMRFNILSSTALQQALRSPCQRARQCKKKQKTSTQTSRKSRNTKLSQCTLSDLPRHKCLPQ